MRIENGQSMSRLARQIQARGIVSHTTYYRKMKEAIKVARPHGAEYSFRASSPSKIGRKCAFSLPALFTCPHATACCILWCYAMQGRFIFDASIFLQAMNLARMEFFRRTDNAFDAAMELHYLFQRCLIVRLGESGDTYHEFLIDVWARLAYTLPRAKVFNYTRNFKIDWSGFLLQRNAFLLLSCDDDNKQECLAYFEKLCSSGFENQVKIAYGPITDPMQRFEYPTRFCPATEPNKPRTKKQCVGCQMCCADTNSYNALGFKAHGRKLKVKGKLLAMA